MHYKNGSIFPAQKNGGGSNMKAFKRKMVRLLVEYTGRPNLFKRIRWTDGKTLNLKI